LPSIRAERKAALETVILSDRVERTDYSVPSIDGGPDVTIRIHRPRDLAGPLSCIFSIHGGGYVLGSYEMDDVRLEKWCTEFGCVGVAVDYRLAPETPYPGPLNDCYAALRWIYDHRDDLGIDPSRIGIAGVSAGGGLAAGLALMARDRGEVALAFQLLIYPMLDDRQQTVSSRWDTPVWNPQSNAFGWRSYLGDLYGTDSIPVTAAPARAEDLTGLPPTLLCVGSADGFCDEDIDFAQRLNQANVHTELHVYSGAPHGFETLIPDVEVSRRSRREITEWLERALAR
jgi:acetyl esterase/lipase